jgi:ABC-type proline/glycine betaine transport system ATPase subunit
MLPDDKNIAEIVRRFDELPDDAVIPSEATAIIHSVSPRTVRRTYPSVQLSPGRKGQRVGTLRAMSRNEKPAV